MMRITQQNHRLLLVESDTPTLAYILLCCALAFGAFAAYRYISDAHALWQEQFQGAVGAAVTALLGFLVAFERSRFEFDRGTGRLHWYRRRALRRSSGVVPLREIRAVTAATPIGDSGVPSRRVALQLGSSELPLSVGYEPDGRGDCLALAEAIRQFIGQAPEPSADAGQESAIDEDELMARVRLLAEQGRVIEAVKTLRTERQLDLVDAKRLVDELRHAGRNSGRRG